MNDQPFQFGILRWFGAVTAAAIPFAIFSNDSFESLIVNSINAIVFFLLAILVQKQQLGPLLKSSAAGIGIGILGLAGCGLLGGILGFVFGFCYFSKDQESQPEVTNSVATDSRSEP